MGRKSHAVAESEPGVQRHDSRADRRSLESGLDSGQRIVFRDHSSFLSFSWILFIG